MKQVYSIDEILAIIEEVQYDYSGGRNKVPDYRMVVNRFLECLGSLKRTEE